MLKKTLVTIDPSVWKAANSNRRPSVQQTAPKHNDEYKDVIIGDNLPKPDVTPKVPNIQQSPEKTIAPKVETQEIIVPVEEQEPLIQAEKGADPPQIETEEETTKTQDNYVNLYPVLESEDEKEEPHQDE